MAPQTLDIEARPDGTFRVASRSRPGTWHDVVPDHFGFYCSCEGYRRRRHCAHQAVVDEYRAARRVPFAYEGLL